MSFTAAPAALRRCLFVAIALSAAALLIPGSALAASLGKRTLKQGMSGQDVRVLQDFLGQVGFEQPIGGDFGPITSANVKRFQQRYRLSVDGVVDADDVAKLRSVVGKPAGAAKSRTRTRSALKTASGRHLGDRLLRKGMTGQDVRVLQDYLGRAGFDTPVDGEFGPTTLRMVKLFQRTQELTVTGVVDAGTVAVLRRIGDAGSAGGADYDTSQVPAPVGRAKLLSNGLAVAPSDAPQEVKDVIAAGNRIATKPYVYGGGHGRWEDSGYDCSGSVSYALHGGGLLDDSMPSGDFEDWELPGRGQWITIYANGGHMYMVVAGLRFDTSGADPSRWQSDMRSNSGFTVRHPAGF